MGWTTMSRSLWIATVVALVLAGCGGGDDNESASPPRTVSLRQATATLEEQIPDQNAEDFMVELTQQTIRGQWGRLYESLHPDHRAIVTRSHFDDCMRAAAEEDLDVPVDVDAIDSYEEPVEIAPTRKEVPSVAVTIRRRATNPLTGKTLESTDTAHAVAVNGEWRWIFSLSGYRQWKSGKCPE
jgi:hypothetical protein